MAQTMVDRGRTGDVRAVQTDAEAAPASSGWMWTWVTIGILVVLVVIGFLIGIVRALESIDAALLTADEAVSGAGGDVVPLPDHIANINTSLTSIDESLMPVPGQADQIIAALTSIRDSLVSVDSSLKDTSGSLVNTSGGLVDTSGVLENVLGLASTIRVTLEGVQAPADNLGTSDIWPRVQVVNDTLTPAKADTGNILAHLVETNEHLNSICHGLPVPGNCP